MMDRLDLSEKIIGLIVSTRKTYEHLSQSCRIIIITRIKTNLYKYINICNTHGTTKYTNSQDSKSSGLTRGDTDQSPPSIRLGERK